MKKLIIALLLCAGSAQATWVGKLDLSPTVSPVVLREVHDGQWLAGITKENIWHLDRNGTQWFHAGLFQAWNAEHGNASFGPIVGLDIPITLAQALGAIGDALALPAFFKPLSLMSSALSINGFGGYRPVHTADVDGPWVYGAAVRLNIAFGVKELQKGL